MKKGMLKISVATGSSAETKQWKNRSYLWADFVDGMRDPQRTHERYAEYLAMTKKEQSKVKDVGGYVCGYLNGGSRRKENVMYRSALTLDLDFAPYAFWDTFTLLWDCAAILHSTHRHSRETPRYRLVVPLDRDVTPDEYAAIARKFAASINIEYFDPTTFDVNRLMFRPSVSKDGEYVFEEQDGDPLCADDILRKYRNWKDISEWPFSKKIAACVHAEKNKKQEDPLVKNNIVGYFCNAYDIHTAITEFIPDVYEPSDENRYTYVQGSTASGLVTYDDRFAYSHHGTDPASGKLCNAFDLVRIHKYGYADTEGDISKSYKLMSDFCRTLGPVKKEIARNIVRDFDDYVKPEDDPHKKKKSKPKTKKDEKVSASVAPETPEDWREQMDVDRRGVYENSAHNITLILRNDPRLKDRMRYDLFSGKKLITKPLPWHTEIDTYPYVMRDVDFSGIRNYIERVYGISSLQKINDAVDLELHRNAFHPVREYLNALEWDGVSRIDTLLTDCFNAADNRYTREVSRKWLVAAVARVMTPGCKYDSVLTLISKEEGTRKSTFFRKLGREWFSDTSFGVTGKESFEQLRGKLIIEFAELSAFNKATSTQIKHYITKQVDSFRPAYGRQTVDYPRQCVIVATANQREFLNGAEGNRRFWPVDVRLKDHTGGKIDPMSTAFDRLVPQIWAEAVAMWRLDEPLVLSAEAELIARNERVEHTEVDDRRGMVEQYLDRDVPEKWPEMPPETRADYLAAPEAYKSKTLGKPYKRKYICIAEIWCECFGKRKEDLDYRKSRELTALMRTVSGWLYRTGLRTFPHYGRQRYYENMEAWSTRERLCA
jgi:predicted P-loop ATPase